MSWDKGKMGYYCDRCGASIWMDVRQEKYLGPKGEGSKAGDPYLSVSRHAFFEPEKPIYSGYQYCFDCEPMVMQVLAALNKEK